MRIVMLLGLALLLALACGDPETESPSTDCEDTPAAAASTPIAVADGPRRIAFVSDRDGPFRLYTMNEDGSDVRRLSDQPVDRFPYSVSRDGTQIAAAAADDDPGEDTGGPLRLHRIDALGGATELTGEAPPSDTELLLPVPVWAPDDASVLVFNQFICYAFPSGGGEVRERDFDECADASIRADGPDARWSAIAGDHLVVGTGTRRSDIEEIDRVLPDGAADEGFAGLAFLALQTFGLLRPVWSPDGTQIAYLDADTADGRTGIAVIPASGGLSRLLVESGEGEEFFPSAWSSDGSRVIFSSMEGEGGIRAVDVASGEVTTLIGGDGHSYAHPRIVVEAPAPARPGVPFEQTATVEELEQALAAAPGGLVYDGGENRTGFFTSQPDGTDERQLSVDSGYPSNTSYGGRWLSYTPRDSGMVVIDTQTGERRVFGEGDNSRVSPTGDRIAYWVPGGLTSTLYVMDLATQDKRALWSGPNLAEVEPSWSPDGARLAFFQELDSTDSDRNADWHLTVVDSATGGMTVIAEVESNLNATGPLAWSPDGSRIAFDDLGVRIAAADAGDEKDFGGDITGVSWSPDGKTLAARGGGVFLIDVESGDAERATSDVAGAVEYPPVWSPDGRWIAYSGTDGTLRVMDVATRTIVRLPTEGDEVSWAAE